MSIGSADTLFIFLSSTAVPVRCSFLFSFLFALWRSFEASWPLLIADPCSAFDFVFVLKHLGFLLCTYLQTRVLLQACSQQSSKGATCPAFVSLLNLFMHGICSFLIVFVVALFVFVFGVAQLNVATVFAVVVCWVAPTG